VDGDTITVDGHDLTGSISGSIGAYTITWNDGYVFTAQDDLWTLVRENLGSNGNYDGFTEGSLQEVKDYCLAHGYHLLRHDPWYSAGIGRGWCYAEASVDDVVATGNTFPHTGMSWYSYATTAPDTLLFAQTPTTEP
jgi:hypothetical protein